MAHNISEACQTALNDSLSEAGEPVVLHDRDFARLAPALDLSTEEWLRILQAHNNTPPSCRRDIFFEPLELQIEMLSVGVYDDDPCSESLALAKRVEALPRILKLTILEAIERLWTREKKDLSLDECLRHLGLRPCASAHARLVALAHRRHVLPG